RSAIRSWLVRSWPQKKRGCTTQSSWQQRSAQGAQPHGQGCVAGAVGVTVILRVAIIFLLRSRITHYAKPAFKDATGNAVPGREPPAQMIRVHWVLVTIQDKIAL